MYVTHKNGLTASRVLRESGFCNLIIGLTGNVFDDDVLEFRMAGANVVLSKPLRLTTLQSLIRFVDAEGCKSRVGFALLEQGNIFAWV
jgi:DNA-binding response OmpR family regulator